MRLPRVRTADEGITGIGESDFNPWMARACIEAPSTHTMGLGLTDVLLGENPLEIERLWDKLYGGSAGRRTRSAVASGPPSSNQAARKRAASRAAGNVGRRADPCRSAGFQRFVRNAMGTGS